MKQSTRRNLEIALSLAAVAAVGAGVVWAYSQPAAGGSAPKPTGTIPGGTPVTTPGGTTVVPGGSPSGGSTSGSTAGGSSGSSGSGSSGGTAGASAPPSQPWENILTPGASMRAYVHSGTTLKLDAPSGGMVLGYRYGNSRSQTAVNASSVTLPAQTQNGTYTIVWKDQNGNTLTSVLSVSIV